MKITLRRALVAAATLAAVFGIGIAAQADQTTDKIKATLQSRIGDADIKSVEKSPVPGLYEVNLGAQIVYTDATGNYLLMGDLVDTRTRTNITEARLAETNKIDFAKLPFENAVKVVKGTGAQDRGVLRSELPVLQAARNHA